jgi:alkylation response protein AidB-like acyl-CoA dehydrogenase
MEFGHTAAENEFRARVRGLLREPPIAPELDRVRGAAAEPDERPLYRLLGAAGLLGAGWPVRLGGQGRTVADQLIVTEELVRAGVPDTLYVNGIQTVGQLLLLAGTAEQQARFLPGLAGGELFASVLYSEPEAGSDLSRLSTAAERDGSGYRLNGTKIYSLKSTITDIGLCAARVPEEGSRYSGITLFLVDMHASGVDVRPLPSLPVEQFAVVTLDNVAAGEHSVLGGAGDGWGLLSLALPLERIGLEFALRAERWYELGCAADDPAGQEELGRYGARVDAARLLAWRAGLAVAAGSPAPVQTSVAKWYSSELASELAGWAVTRHCLDAEPGLRAAVDRVYREAPGLTLSGGTSEMMAQLLSGYLLDSAEERD